MALRLPPYLAGTTEIPNEPGFVSRYLVPFGQLLPDDEMHIREGGEHHGEEPFHPLDTRWV
jgi:hypothetical protein